ncbi:hypothetical protein [Hyalangium versicolor]|uniref:hypothetical protein n=1 Tax=Hyalangium versicolor TaxID=2861190 RepID=UPI001CCEABC3|nr:hypothetical protein [Hyalangium versicolor]
MTTERITFHTAWLLVLLMAPLASAQTLSQDLDAGAQNPWTQGVSPKQQADATMLFNAGNRDYEKALFLSAADFYRKALAQWEHPAIHYNLALALMDTGRKLELREHLEAAVRYGSGPLEQKLFEHAKQLKTFIEKQLVRVDVSCEAAGVSVSMDGRLLFTSPGRYEGWELPGSHVFLATQEGYPPNQRTRVTREGESITLHIQGVYDDVQLTRYRRKWAAWKPWSVLGVGAALVAGGAFTHLQGRSDIRAFDDTVKRSGDTGLKLTPDLDALRSRGMRLQKVGVGAYGVGGAAIVAGVILTIVNRAEPYRLSPDEYEEEATFTWGVASSGRGLRFAFRF